MAESKIVGDVSSANSVVLYHDNCLDGFGAACAAYMFASNKGDLDNWAFIPVRYGEELPIIGYQKVVYILDFSYNKETLTHLCSFSKHVVLIDHHKTAIEELEAWMTDEADVAARTVRFKPGIPTNITIRLSQDKSGCMLAWDWFMTDTEAPEVLKHIQDRDLWEFRLLSTKEVCKALVNLPRTFEAWELNLINSTDMLLALEQDGEAQLVEYNNQLSAIQENIYPCTLLGKKGIACNAPPAYASELGNLLANRIGTFGATWHYAGAGIYKVSLRSIGDFDVSEIAKQFGGGGHKNAAGFTIDRSIGQKLRHILIDESYQDETKDNSKEEGFKF